MGGNLSRRDLLEGAAIVAVSTTATIVLRHRAEADVSEAEKISQADAKYQSTPNGQQRCEICIQFESPDHCKIVRSPISANGWCQYFAARENAH
jgi:hypothetical protein